MPVAKILFAAFLLVPLAEIYVLIEVGSLIGALPTVALVVLTAVAGAGLIRAQGLATLARARAVAERGEVPAMELLEGVCLLVAGAFLLTPGFVTDTAGFLLLVPALRRHLFRVLVARGMVRVSTRTPGGRGQRTGPTGSGRVIEGEFRREDP
jgi:UPF0716 protein FxsA